MIAEIINETNQRGVTRLCHFTPSRNLVHIVAGNLGILSTRRLSQHERGLFTPTDILRLDGHDGYICCSIQYPNAWYFDKARAGDALFRDWVVLFIDAKFLSMPGTKFCQRNAATGYGRHAREGIVAFRSMFDETVLGAYNKTFRRGPKRLLSVPTDEQAEVLVPDRIALESIKGVAVPSESQAKNEVARLRLLGVKEVPFRIVIAPTLFDKHSLSNALKNGVIPSETPWPQGKA